MRLPGLRGVPLLQACPKFPDHPALLPGTGDGPCPKALEYRPGPGAGPGRFTLCGFSTAAAFLGPRTG